MFKCLQSPILLCLLHTLHAAEAFMFPSSSSPTTTAVAFAPHQEGTSTPTRLQYSNNLDLMLYSPKSYQKRYSCSGNFCNPFQMNMMVSPSLSSSIPLSLSSRSLSSRSSSSRSFSSNWSSSSIEGNAHKSALFKKINRIDCSRDSIHHTLMKGTVSPNSNSSNDVNGLQPERNIFYRIFAKLWRLLKTVFAKIFKISNTINTKKDEEVDTAKESNGAESSVTKMSLDIMDTVEKTSKKVEEINNRILDLDTKKQSSATTSADIVEDNTLMDDKDTATMEETVESLKTSNESLEVVDYEIEEEEKEKIDVANLEEEESTVVVNNDEKVIEEESTIESTSTDDEEVVVVEQKSLIPNNDKKVVVEEQVEETSTVSPTNQRALEVDDIPSTTTAATAATTSLPKGNRWAISAPDVDLSAVWKIVVDDKFKEEYDNYLKNLGQPALVRSIAVNIVELTTEEVVQGDDGRTLSIKGKNLRGVWERTLISSGADYDHDFNEEEDEHDRVDIITADKEKVLAEAWWEEEGTVHRSYLRGVKKYGGGDFESRRYLKDGGETLVCESVFHPSEGKEPAVIKWTFTKT